MTDPEKAVQEAWAALGEARQQLLEAARRYHTTRRAGPRKLERVQTGLAAAIQAEADAAGAYAAAREIAGQVRVLDELASILEEPLEDYFAHDHAEEVLCDESCSNYKVAHLRAAVLRGELGPKEGGEG